MAPPPAGPSPAGGAAGSAAPAVFFTQGLKIGSWTTTRQLGRGGFAEIWLGENPQHPRSDQKYVALKIFLMAMAGDIEKELVRFSQEFSVMRHLAGEPDIVQVLAPHSVSVPSSVGNATIHPCFAMEYLDPAHWPTLEKQLENGRPLAPDDAVRTALLISQAVQKAHDKGITHRDLKPANVFCNALGNVKVGDFGIATKPDEFPRLTATSSYGTPGYVPHEQFVAGLPPTEGMDVYAVGVMLFEMLHPGTIKTARWGTPFLEEALALRPAPVAWNPAWLNSRLKEIIERAIAHWSADRYQRTAELIYDLENYLSGGTLSFPSGGRAAPPAGSASPIVVRHASLPLALHPINSVPLRKIVPSRAYRLGQMEYDPAGQRWIMVFSRSMLDPGEYSSQRDIQWMVRVVNSSLKVDHRLSTDLTDYSSRIVGITACDEESLSIAIDRATSEMWIVSSLSAHGSSTSYRYFRFNLASGEPG